MKINLYDTKNAYCYKNFITILKTWLLFKFLANNTITNFLFKVTTWLQKKKLSPNFLIKSTIYSVFCGGEDIKKTKKTVSKLYNLNVKSILDYSSEGIDNDIEFEKSKKIILETIHNAYKNYKQIPFSVFKPSAIGHISLYKKVSCGITLSDYEKSIFEKVKNRFHEIASYASLKKIKLLVDAEESWLQNSVDEIVLELMNIYNKENVIVFNTIQMYRKNRIEVIENYIEEAEKKSFKIGIKLVRGAYLEKEKERAKRLNYPCPIQESKKKCDEDFNKAFLLIMNNLDNCELMLATHNIRSCELLIENMKAKNIKPNDSRIYFAQLYGMSDNISMNLSKNNFNVAKYLPFATVDKIIPYLYRRAKENSSIKGQSSRELSFLTKEIKRRYL